MRIILDKIAAEVRGDMRKSELLRLIQSAKDEWKQTKHIANESIVILSRVRHAIQGQTFPTAAQGQKPVK